MRNDLDSALLAKMASDSRTPIQVAVFHFDSFGDIGLADRDFTLDGVYYSGLVEDWGTLATVGAENGLSGTMQVSITLWNGGSQPFSDYFFYQKNQ